MGNVVKRASESYEGGKVEEESTLRFVNKRDYTVSIVVALLTSSHLPPPRLPSLKTSFSILSIFVHERIPILQ